MSAKMKLSEVLSEKDIAKLKPIIDYLETLDGISPQTAKLLINKSEATVRRYLRILVESGLVAQQGKTNNVIYVIHS